MEKIEQELLDRLLSQDVTIGVGMIIILIITIFFMFKHFSSGYSSKKGENLADKQDIQELTNKVEEVKSEFASRTEELKAKLGLNVQLELSRTDEIKKILLNMNRVAIEYWTFVRDTDLLIDDQSNNTSILKTMGELNKTILSYQKAEAEIELFIDNKELNLKIYELRTLLHSYTGYAKHYLNHLEHNNTRRLIVEKYEDQYTTDEVIKKHTELASERNEIYEKWFSHFKNKEYKDLIKSKSLFVSLIRIELDKLLT